MACHLFFASTPFNMLTASMVAFSLPEQDTKLLLLIDQPASDSAFVHGMLNWAESPFALVQIASRKASGKGKVARRRQALNGIKGILEAYQPGQIYTGNDRRIEFQFAMAHSPAHTRGVYIDDGTYTYLGRKTHWLKDHLLDNLAKKLTYGWWWKQPATIGASGWIRECIVAFPDSVVAALNNKTLTQLPLNLERPEFQALAALCLGDDPRTVTRLASLSALALLPHSSVVQGQNLTAIQRWLAQQPGPCAIKHHPRSEDKTAFVALQQPEIPARIPMEVMLPMLQADCAIIGDCSTALLTAKWLRPSLQVVVPDSDNLSPAWRALLQQLDIRVLAN